MTTVQSMLKGAARALACIGLSVLAAGAAAGISGCAKKERLVPPEVVVSPYNAAAGDVVWAVAPLVNESGTGVVDPLAVSDALVASVTEVEGLAGIPMNRTLYAMRALGMNGVRSGADARRLAETLGADGVVVGTITAYDPYNPPTIGLALALFARDGSLATRPGNPVDPKALRGAYTDGGEARVAPVVSEQPVAVVSEHLHGANQGVQMNLQRYATGRHDPASALGWRRYLASMDLYTEFASHWTVRRLLDEERLRLARPSPPVDRTADVSR